MFEEIIEFHHKKILKIFENNEIAYFYEIENNEGIPNWIKAYFNAKINLELHNSLNQISEYLPFEIPDFEVQNAWQSFELTLKSNAKFDSNTIDKWIIEAIQNYLNFLIRPRFTLINFIYQNNFNLFTDYIKNQLSFFPSSHYLIEEVNSNLDNLHNNSESMLSKVDFKKLIDKIDDNYFRNKTPGEFCDIFDPIYDIFNIVNSEQKFLPISALKIIFSDKKWYALENALISIQQKTQSILWTESQVIEFLNNYNNIDFDSIINNQIPLYNQNVEE